MATNLTQDASALEGALDQIKAVLGADETDCSQKIQTSLEMLDESLACLSGLGLVARLAVEVQAKTTEGKRYVRKYSLATRKGWDEEGKWADLPYLKKTELEEDE